MKISELIAALERIKEQHGDVEVAYYDGTFEDAGCVEKVEFSPEGEFHHYLQSGDNECFYDPLAVLLCGWC